VRTSAQAIHEVAPPIDESPHISHGIIDILMLERDFAARGAPILYRYKLVCLAHKKFRMSRKCALEHLILLVAPRTLAHAPPYHSSTSALHKTIREGNT
jgi:hypothetical protein